ncbi:YciI family protein [Sphaerisporangium sp. NPDC051017]|uniref:YciI family protein n=1 Tax=Sphaerisporangium sp. NPDC051017 TaxID=3154636 RepID=UPI0034392057
MAKYLILIYEDEASWANAGPEDYERAMKEHTAFGENNRDVLRGGEALHPGSMGTSVRKDASGDFVVTDGAFFETKEGLGGYYLIEVDDLDQAIAVAKQVPAPYGGVEVRPVMVFS